MKYILTALLTAVVTLATASAFASQKAAAGGLDDGTISRVGSPAQEFVYIREHEPYTVPAGKQLVIGGGSGRMGSSPPKAPSVPFVWFTAPGSPPNPENVAIILDGTVGFGLAAGPKTVVEVAPTATYPKGISSSGPITVAIWGHLVDA